MKCIICGNKNLYLIKKVGNGEIFECKKCRLGLTRGVNVNEKNLKKLYDFHKYKSSEPKLKKRAKKIISLIEKFKDTGNVLEVGSGFGLFSHILLQTEKYHLTIVEPFLPIKYLKNNHSFIFFKMKIEDFLKINKRKYDLIILLDVLEHLKNPLTILNKLKKHLKKDGFLVIQVPNYQSLIAKVCRHWAWWLIEEHYFHFSPISIVLLLTKAGYKIDFLTTYEDFIDFKKNLDGNFSEIRFSFIRKFVKFLFYPPFFLFYFLTNKIIWKFNYGGLIFIIASGKVKN